MRKWREIRILAEKVRSWRCVWGDRALWGVESLFNVGSFFVVWRKAGERWKMRWVVHNVRWNL